MFRRIVFSIALVAILAMSQVGAAQAAPPISTCTEQTVDLGGGFHSIYLICMPLAVPWNHQLVVFAHGYVPNVSADPILPKDQLDAIGGVNLADTINSMGYAFAMTSYPVNGLAILPGVQDVVNLVQFFKGSHPGTTNVFLTGASEGGLITTLALEKNPAVFKGGFAVCGPIGSWQGQVNHFGDFRVLFDYFFPGVMPVSGDDPLHPQPGDYSAINIPDYLPLSMAIKGRSLIRLRLPWHSIWILTRQKSCIRLRKCPSIRRSRQQRGAAALVQRFRDDGCPRKIKPGFASVVEPLR